MKNSVLPSIMMVLVETHCMRLDRMLQLKVAKVDHLFFTLQSCQSFFDLVVFNIVTYFKAFFAAVQNYNFPVSYDFDFSQFWQRLELNRRKISWYILRWHQTSSKPLVCCFETETPDRRFVGRRLPLVCFGVSDFRPNPDRERPSLPSFNTGNDEWAMIANGNLLHVKRWLCSGGIFSVDKWLTVSKSSFA